MRYTIKNGKFKVTADTLGAELVGVEKDGEERLWQNDNGSWGGHAPILFPVCGNCLMTVNGKDYPIKKHGFARRLEFLLKEHSEKAMTFELTSNPDTMLVYPYPFILRVKYEVGENRIFITYEVENPEDKDLYFSIGGHEAFALKESVENYHMRFTKGQKLVAIENNLDGLLTGKTRGTWESELPLKEEDFENGNTFIFNDPAITSVALCDKNDKMLVLSKFEGFTNLLFWKSAGGKMICIEPWLNLPDSVGEHLEYSKKAGILCVKPHEKKLLKREIIFY